MRDLPRFLVGLCCTILFFIPWMPLFSATGNLDRPYDPVVVKGAEMPTMLSAPIHDLFVYRYKNGLWQQVPFQFDERDGKDYSGVKDGVLSATDELCFMARDMGDGVADWNWINNLESMTFPRIEICAIDTADESERRSYVYVYQSPTLSKDNTILPYMTYIPPPKTSVGSDTIRGFSYKFAHNVNSIPEYLAIRPTVGGSNIDILDRWKLRFGGQIAGIYQFSGTEDPGSADKSGLEFDTLLVKTGDVRIIRTTIYYISLGGSLIADPTYMTNIFYPFSEVIDAENRSLENVMGLTSIRQAMDYNSNMIGAKFYNPNNDGLLIDGVSDKNQINDQLTIPGINWHLVKGNQGFLMTIADLPTAGTSQKLFYLDSAKLDIYDTGDFRRYGESGFLFEGTTTHPISGSFSLTSTLYYLGPDHTLQYSEILLQHFSSPLDVSLVSTNYVVPVELSSFQVRVAGLEVLLTWSTATETNNYGFQIERRDVSGKWQQVGFVKGAGTTQSPRSYRFTDAPDAVGKYDYRLKQIDTDGQFEYSPIMNVEITVPAQFVLGQNYPNPFNPQTEIAVQIPEVGEMSLTVFNLLGQEVKTLYKGMIVAGLHRYTWDGQDHLGRETPSGTFVYRLQWRDQVQYKKMVKLE